MDRLLKLIERNKLDFLIKDELTFRFFTLIASGNITAKNALIFLLGEKRKNQKTYLRKIKPLYTKKKIIKRRYIHTGTPKEPKRGRTVEYSLNYWGIGRLIFEYWGIDFKELDASPEIEDIEGMELVSLTQFVQWYNNRYGDIKYINDLLKFPVLRKLYDWRKYNTKNKKLSLHDKLVWLYKFFRTQIEVCFYFFLKDKIDEINSWTKNLKCTKKLELRYKHEFENLLSKNKKKKSKEEKCLAEIGRHFYKRADPEGKFIHKLISKMRCNYEEIKSKRRPEPVIVDVEDLVKYLLSKPVKKQ